MCRKSPLELLLELLCGQNLDERRNNHQIAICLTSLADCDRSSPRAVRWTHVRGGDRARVPNFKSQRLTSCFVSISSSKPASEPVTRSRTKITAPASIPIDSSTKIGCKLTEAFTLWESLFLGFGSARERPGDDTAQMLSLLQEPPKLAAAAVCAGIVIYNIFLQFVVPPMVLKQMRKELGTGVSIKRLVVRPLAGVFELRGLVVKGDTSTTFATIDILRCTTTVL